MDTLLFALNAILPIILLILFGYLLKQKNFLDEDWFKKGNNLIFRVCPGCCSSMYTILSPSQISTGPW